ncbi:hypothetical protein TCAL_16243 [Tigriopus californicus]|uniref:Membrane insertase YidC/Oxa/ALB C-terminal domain-containing protein n=1 Tax=Tigriopus californicus TaxID=6832 RepID=A0A553N9Q0_TIGCA|nr:mitochondrial inner membrane protein OXA1L-like [Tigriopus californicus]TRY62174.1 hypothetical protein TCAL_16243 [Tigriopus californicus]|eukprot:TCALIF_01760-PB protein Name:"Similar to Oxa1l Mitochondrial inner membrane protein OXA1L (Mus musculus)" AED:0.27 eAED:0.27 QI:79/1/1/1/1/1/5/119/357
MWRAVRPFRVHYGAVRSRPGGSPQGSSLARRALSASAIRPDAGLEAGLSATVPTEPILNALGEPTFQSLGLGHAYPSGWVQSGLELIHVQSGLPWWVNIVTATCLLRFLLFPIVVNAQRSMAAMHNVMPQVKQAQAKILNASDRKAGQAASQEYQRILKDNKVSPLGPFGPMLIQGGCFTSMFFGIRGMANQPVESMQSQGILWFTDLTVADPLLVLPVVTAGSLFLFIYSNAEIDSGAMGQTVRKVMLALPVLSIPAMCFFPAALNLYWLTNNILTIGQAMLIKLPAVRTQLGIPARREYTPQEAEIVASFLPRAKPKEESLSSSTHQPLKGQIQDFTDIEKRVKASQAARRRKQS